MIDRVWIKESDKNVLEAEKELKKINNIINEINKENTEIENYI